MAAIPKIIHYCWFGKGEKSELITRCIESWKTYCPDYQIIEWNEDNSNIGECDYVKEAFYKKKWAFVSDYIRLAALRDYGGIYLDTDVELIKGFDDLLDNAFVGYAEDLFIGTATIACEKGNEWCKLIINEYNRRHFVSTDGTLDMMGNNEFITEVTLKNSAFRIGDNNISIGNVTVYPTEYFAPYKKLIYGKSSKIYALSNYTIKDCTICVHHTELSWQPENRTDIINKQCRQLLRVLLPSKVYWKIKKFFEMRRLGWQGYEPK